MNLVGYLVIGILVIVNFLSSILHILGGVLVGYALSDLLLDTNSVLPLYADYLLIFIGSMMIGYQIKQWRNETRRIKERLAQLEGKWRDK